MLVFAPTTSLASLRRQVDALKRKLDRLLAAHRIKVAANHIVQLWNIAVAKSAPHPDTGIKPKPDPIDCVHIMADAGFRPESWNPLHGYIDRCEYYQMTPDAQEIINKLHLPKKLASLIAALPNPSPAS